MWGDDKQPVKLLVKTPGDPILMNAHYGTQIGQHLSDDQVKKNIIKATKRYQKENPSNAKPIEPGFVVFSNHSP